MKGFSGCLFWDMMIELNSETKWKSETLTTRLLPEKHNTFADQVGWGSLAYIILYVLWYKFWFIVDKMKIEKSWYAGCLCYEEYLSTEYLINFVFPT